MTLPITPSARDGANQPTRKAREFERLVLPHRDALYSHALSLTRNADEAEDLVQETTLRALRGFDTFRADGPIRAWLLTILRNLFINGYRARARAPRAVSLDALENPDPLVPIEPGPERQVFSRMENEALGRAVANLPCEYREVLEMSDMRGLSYQEISEQLNVPIGTVRSRLSRARSRVRRALFAWRPDAQGAKIQTAPRSKAVAEGFGFYPGLVIRVLSVGQGLVPCRYSFLTHRKTVNMT